MADVPVLVCTCGMRLKAAGAVPGRVGRCPRCGGLLRVPGETEPSPSEPEPSAGNYDVSSDPLARRPSAFAAPPGRQSPRRADEATPKDWDGFVKPPLKPETRLRESVLYPLWGIQGLFLLLFFPPALWFVSQPVLTVLTAPSGPGETPLQTRMFALLGLLPASLGLFVVGGFVLLFLGRVLVSSAIGEVHHPRWPEWDFWEMMRGAGRWFWALLIGGVVGGFPATAYWMYCGHVDGFDRIVIAELLALGAVYGQMALLASLLHDDPLGANPITVFVALWRVGWGSVRPALVAGVASMLVGVALMGVLEIKSPALSAVAYWAFWVGLLYAAMVVLRVLGLFYHRHARVLGWFRDRPRWGV